MQIDVFLPIIIIGTIYGIMEISLFVWVSYVRKKFQWLITSKNDEMPVLSKEGLKKAIKLKLIATKFTTYFLDSKHQ